MTTTVPDTTTPGRISATDCDLATFARLVEVGTDLAAYPTAERVVDNVLVYAADDLRAAVRAGGQEQVEAELVRALADGPGVLVVTGAYPETDVVDRATAAFGAMIAEEKAAGGPAGDHFAKAGANDRVWNALEKLAVHDPGTFVDYYANDVLALVSTAWLGPAYQMTSQVNLVRPGGRAQDPHRDYHLGFLSDATVERYPRHVHLLSPVLTLQGAVAHSDMPVDSGPTMFLPHSHRYDAGYLAWRRPEFRDYFLAHFVQLPLAKGDAVFFNPALFHGAGTNRSADVQRMANLLQVSSAFGRAMESVDRVRTVRAVYPALLERQAAGAPGLENAVAAAAEGYPFPTNLDLDQPVDGLTPLAQSDILEQALAGSWTPQRLDEALDSYADRRLTHERTAL